MRIKTYIILFVMLLPAVCLSQDLEPFSGRVSVVVNSNNEGFKREIESYIIREFQSLGDIVVTDDKPEWVIQIVALEMVSKAGLKMGIVLSTVTFYHFDNKLLLNVVDVKYKEAFSKSTSKLYSLLDHMIRAGASEDLRSICNAIVVDFDTKRIKPARELWQMSMDAFKKGMENKKK